MLANAGMTLLDEAVTPARLLAVGSILHFARDDDVIWGSGVNGKMPADAHSFERLDVRAVRGPLTADFLTNRGISVPPIVGDPSLLVPRLFQGRFERTDTTGPIFIPNLHDLGRYVGDVPVVSPLLPWDRVVRSIVESDLVLASSLHGLILADAFGVPARYVRLSETESLFKYQDHYYATGRDLGPPAMSVEDGIRRGGAPVPEMDTTALYDAFPYDLWKGSTG